MTKGSPLRLIIFFTIPVLLGNIFQNVYNLMDSVIVGRFLGVNALAAVGTTGTLAFVVFGWITGMTGGFGILLAQSFGAGDEKRLRHYTVMSLYLCIIMAAVMTGGLLLMNRGILKLMNTPDTIIDDTAGYIGIIYAGLPVTIAYNMLSAVSRSLGDSRTPLIFLILSSVLNVILDILLIAVIPLGVRGAAYATVIAQAVSVVSCFFYIKKKYDILKIRKEEWGFSAASAGRMMMMGVPMALQFSITGIGTVMVQAAVNLLGATYIAAFSASGKICNIVTQAFPSIGITLATYVGQNMGAGEIRRIRQGVKITQIITIIVGVVCGLAVFFWGGAASRLFVADPTGEIRTICNEYFHATAWCYPFLGSIFIYRNTLQGMGDGLVPMVGGIFELLARGIMVTVLAGPLGFLGICLCDPGAWLAALIPLVPVYIIRMKKIAKIYTPARSAGGS